MTTVVPPSMLEEDVPTQADLLHAIPFGVPLPFAGATLPTGWLWCYGQAVSRTTYASLFAVLGTTYNTGGEAGTDFRVPDLRGRVPVGKDNMGGTPANRVTTGVSGVDAATLGAVGGSQLLQEHDHPYQMEEISRGSDGLGVEVLQAFDGAGTPITVGDAGTGQSQNVQPSIVLNYIIRGV